MNEELVSSESFHVFFLQIYLCLIHFSTNLRAEQHLDKWSQW